MWVPEGLLHLPGGGLMLPSTDSTSVAFSSVPAEACSAPTGFTHPDTVTYAFHLRHRSHAAF